MDQATATLISPKLLGDVVCYLLGMLYACRAMERKHRGFIYACVRGVTGCGRRVKSVMQVGVHVVHVK